MDHKSISRSLLEFFTPPHIADDALMIDERKPQTYRNGAAQVAATAPRRVAVLPPELANQIAAGEVVERPASVVKELAENSLDAGARKIEVTIANGGRDLIRIVDDGCGMEREDALRALERHATSKITSVEDLFRIGTLGFRGEAIPSIGSVSRLEIRTKPHGHLDGTAIVVRGGTVETVEDVGMAAGTVMQVEHLFYNTPARLKFLKTPATESRHISEMLIRMGLSRPDVRFRLVRDGQTKLDLPAVDDLKDRVLSIMGREIYDALYPTYEYPAINGVVARGYFSKPGHKQRTPKQIYTFVNGRYVSDSTIRAAVKGAYGTLMDKGRHPCVVLFLDVPFDMVDINVHPAKHEVRFHDTNSIYRAVYHSIADALAEAPWVKREARTYTLSSTQQSWEPKDGRPESAPKRERYVSPGMATMRPIKREDDRSSDFAARLSPSMIPARAPSQQGFRARGAQPLEAPISPDPFAQRDTEPQEGEHVDVRVPRREGEGGYFSSLRVIGQFKRQYIVCEDATSMVVVDQHAAHERIGFERLKKIFATDHKESQPLLFPKRLELDAMKAEVMAENLDFFERAGFEIEHFGGTSYVLKSVPAIFVKANIDKIVRDALDDLDYHGRTDRMDEAMEALLSRMACHSVVRGPTTLTQEECYGLFVQMDAIDFAANCPHGRPVYWRMSLTDLEKAFDRIK